MKAAGVLLVVILALCTQLQPAATAAVTVGECMRWAQGHSSSQGTAGLAWAAVPSVGHIATAQGQALPDSSSALSGATEIRAMQVAWRQEELGDSNRALPLTWGMPGGVGQPPEWSEFPEHQPMNEAVCHDLSSESA